MGQDMVLYISAARQNSALLLAAMLLLFFLLFARYHARLYLRLARRRLRWTAAGVLLRPFLLFRLAFRRTPFFLSLLFFAAAAGLGISFFSALSLVFPLRLAAALFLPLAFLCVLLLHYFLLVEVQVLRRLFDVGDDRLNTLFAFLFIEILLCYAGYPGDAQDLAGEMAFFLSVFDLMWCYALTAAALRMILHSILSHTAVFTHRNLWKVALLIIMAFLFILTLLCRSGAAADPAAYSQQGLTTFDLFYYVVATFGTVGYGDIAPVSVYARGMAILIIFTSIACLSIMVSSFLSLSDREGKA